MAIEALHGVWVWNPFSVDIERRFGNASSDSAYVWDFEDLQYDICGSGSVAMTNAARFRPRTNNTRVPLTVSSLFVSEDL